MVHLAVISCTPVIPGQGGSETGEYSRVLGDDRKPQLVQSTEDESQCLGQKALALSTGWCGTRAGGCPHAKSVLLGMSSINMENPKRVSQSISVYVHFYSAATTSGADQLDIGVYDATSMRSVCSPASMTFAGQLGKDIDIHYHSGSSVPLRLL